MYESITKTQDEILDERTIDKIKDKICIAESDLLKTIEYKLTFENPYTYIDHFYKAHFHDQSKAENREIYLLARIIMLDIHRTGASLFYKSNVLALAALLYSVFLTKGEILPDNYAKQAEHEIKIAQAKKIGSRKNSSEMKNDATIVYPPIGRINKIGYF